MTQTIWKTVSFEINGLVVIHWTFLIRIWKKGLKFFYNCIKMPFKNSRVFYSWLTYFTVRHLNMSNLFICRTLMRPSTMCNRVVKINRLEARRIAAISWLYLLVTDLKATFPQFSGLCHMSINNYSPKCRWLAVDIYRAAKQRRKYSPLATDT